MDPQVTVKENGDFRRIYRKGRSAVSGGVVVYCLKNRKGMSRLGITVSTKLGHAVCATVSAAVCGSCTACTGRRCSPAMT